MKVDMNHISINWPMVISVWLFMFLVFYVLTLKATKR